MKYDNIVIVIPCLNPDEKFLGTLQELTTHGFQRIIVVNDGSSKEYDNIFCEAVEKYHVDLLKHCINLGQGRACKTAYNFYYENYRESSVGIVQCDADGQHHIEDIEECASLLVKHPEKFILGTRDFNNPIVPFRSRFGNKCTSAVFRFLYGLKISDTQSGLKGIPNFMIPTLLETPGERFEYATSVLLEIQKEWGDIYQYDIKTIYIEGNRSSHFKPLVDSYRIYKTILKYSIASLLAVCMDFLVFSLAVAVLGDSLQKYIYYASLAAGMTAGLFNFLINKKIVFGVSGNVRIQMIKYFFVNITRAVTSAFLIKQLLLVMNLNVVLLKVIVDTALFFVVYYVLHMWVFKRSEQEISNSTVKEGN